MNSSLTRSRFFINKSGIRYEYIASRSSRGNFENISDTGRSAELLKIWNGDTLEY